MLSIYFSVALAGSLLIFFLKKKGVNNLIILSFLALQTALTTYAFTHLNERDSLFFKFDSLGIILTVVLTLLSYATFYHSWLYHKRHPFGMQCESLYYAALIMLTASMNGAYFAEHIGVMCACIEATTLCVAALIYHERTPLTVEAAWKYVFICSIGIAIAFTGILFLSAAASSVGVVDLNLPHLLAAATAMHPMWLKIAFVLVLTGFSAKMGLFPLHTVCVDAHTAAPPPISAFISTTLMNVGFLGIYRIYTIIAQTDALPWARSVLLICGTISIALSAIQLLKVKHFKRMFAFSSLEHMGIIALALAAGGIGYYAAILHLVLHSFAKASLFYQIGQVHDLYHSYWVKDSGRYLKLNPLGALVIILAFLSITAMPPSGLFVSEFLVFKSLFIANHYFIAIAALLLLTVIIFVFGKNLAQLLYLNGKGIPATEEANINKIETISQFVLLGLIIYLGVNPPDLFNELINGATAILK